VIVKVMTRDGWMLFEGKRVSWKVVDSTERVPEYSSKTFNFLLDNDTNENEVRFEVYVEQGDEELNIFTNNVVYILNNEGKTIERL